MLVSVTAALVASLLPVVIAQEAANGKPANYARIHHPHSKTVWHAGETVSVHWSYVHSNNTEIYRADLLRGVKHDLVYIVTLCQGLTPKSTSCTAKLPTDLWQYTYTVRVSPDFTILPSDKSDFFFIKNPNDPRSTTTTSTTTTTTTTTTRTRTTAKPTTTTTTTRTRTKTTKTKTKTTTKKPRPTTTKGSHPTPRPPLTTTWTLPPPRTTASTPSIRVPTPTSPVPRGDASEVMLSRSALRASALAAAFSLLAVIYVF